MSAFDAVSPDVLNKDVMKKVRQAIKVVRKRGRRESQIFNKTLITFFGLTALAFGGAEIGRQFSATIPQIVSPLLDIAAFTSSGLALPVSLIRGNKGSMPLSEMRKDLQAYKAVRKEAMAHPEDQKAQWRYRLAAEGYLPKLQATLDNGGKRPTEAQINKARAKFAAPAKG